MRIIVITIVMLGCSAPTWPEGAELTLRERTVDAIGVIWDDVENAADYVASIDGQEQIIEAPFVEARFEGLDESHLYLIEVRARSLFGKESEPLRLQARTRDGSPPVWPDGAELSYELTNAARFAWPEARDGVGVVGYALRDADNPDTELQHVRETMVVHDEPPPRRIELVALDAAGNESEPLRVELSDDEMTIFEERRMAYHREFAEDFDMSRAGDIPDGINPALLRDLIEERERGQ